jgi:uncharacterized protein YndB with AHSA1/START domain
MDESLFEEFAGEVAVERSVDLDAEPTAVWDHLVDGDLLSEWMEAPVGIDPRPGGRIEMTPEEGPVTWGTVEEVIPGERLQWSWRTDEGLPTLVEIELAPKDTGTTLTVRETLLPWTVGGMPPLEASVGAFSLAA